MSTRARIWWLVLAALVLVPATASAVPKLYISSFTVAVSDRTVTYTAKVCNGGTSVSQTFDIELYYHRTTAPGCSSADSQHSYQGGLGAGQCTTRTFTRSNAPTGTYTAWVLADADCVVLQDEPDDNYKSATYTVNKPDLYVSSFTTKVTDRSVSYTATVCN